MDAPSASYSTAGHNKMFGSYHKGICRKRGLGDVYFEMPAVSLTNLMEHGLDCLRDSAILIEDQTDIQTFGKKRSKLSNRERPDNESSLRTVLGLLPEMNERKKTMFIAGWSEDPLFFELAEKYEVMELQLLQEMEKVISAQNLSPYDLGAELYLSASTMPSGSPKFLKVDCLETAMNITSIMNRGRWQYEGGNMARIFDEKKIYSSYFDTAPPQQVPEIFEDLNEFFVILKGNFVEDFFPSRYIESLKIGAAMAAQDAAEAAAAIGKKKKKAKGAAGAASRQAAAVAQKSPALTTKSTSAVDAVEPARVVAPAAAADPVLAPAAVAEAEDALDTARKPTAELASAKMVAAVAALSKLATAAVADAQAAGAPANVVVLSPLAEIAATPVTPKVKTKTAAAAIFFSAALAGPGAESAAATMAEVAAEVKVLKKKIHKKESAAGLVKAVAAADTVTVEGWRAYGAGIKFKEESDAASGVETAATKATKAGAALDAAADEARMAAGAAAKHFPHDPPCPPPDIA